MCDAGPLSKKPEKKGIVMDVSSFYTPAASSSNGAKSTVAGSSGAGSGTGAAGGIDAFLGLLLEKVGAGAGATGQGTAIGNSAATAGTGTGTTDAQTTVAALKALATKISGAQEDGTNQSVGESLLSLLASLPENAGAQDILDALKKAGFEDVADFARTLARSDLRAAHGDAVQESKEDALEILRDILDGASQDDLAAISALLTANDNSPASAGSQAQGTGAETSGLSISKEGILDTLDNIVSSGLTPAQISELAEKLRALKEEKGEAMDAAFLAALLGQDPSISAGETGAASEAGDEGTAQSPSLAEIDTRALLTQALAAGKNKTSGKTGTGEKPTAADLIAALNGALEKKSLIGPASEPMEKGEDTLLAFSQDADGTKGKMTLFAGGVEGLAARMQAQGAALSGNGGAAASSANASVTASSGTGVEPLLSSATGWNGGEESFQDWLNRISGASISVASGQGTAPGISTSAPTLANSGVQTASQVIAASIFRSAQGGEARTMTLQLDPPELGRVAIKMEMDRNRAMKTVLTIEKPETHSLLQRDAHMLERALQNAGIDTSGGESLSFELAGEGFSFDQGGGQNDGQGGSAPRSGTENASVIETRMDWYVDPDTGIQRYDIVV